MTNNKMTKKQVVEMMMNDEAIKGNTLYMAFLEKELAALSRKRTNSGKPTAKQIENEALQEDILLYIELLKRGLTAKEVATAFNCSSSKASSMLNQMVTKGKIVKSEGILWYNAETNKNERKSLFHTADISYSKDAETAVGAPTEE